MGVNEDFDRLQAVAQQHSPQHRSHGPSTGTIAAVGALAWLGARAYRHHLLVQEGSVPRGWKWNVWGWYVALAAAVHFVIWLAWFANAYVDNPFSGPFWLIGAAVWLPTWVLVYLHQSAIKRHNIALRSVQPAASQPGEN